MISSGRKFFGDVGKYLQKNLSNTWKGLRGEIIQIPEIQVLYDFKQPETINNFVLLTDMDIGGKSFAELCTSKHGRLLFTGHLSTDIDKHKEADHSGFCGIRSKPLVGLFNKVETTDMTYYDAVEIKYRGDGRCFFVNLQAESMMFQNQYDLFQSFLFTKGGPYWEIERIPFSKFIMTYKGYLQDEQKEFDNIRTLGISVSDKKTGPFHLEIEYIKMVKIGHQPVIFKHQKYKRFQPSY